MMRLSLILVAIAVLAAGCSTGRASGICGSLDPTMKGDAAPHATEGSTAWDGRLKEANVRKAITAWKKSLAINPQQPKLRVRLARAHYLLADGFLRFDEDKNAEMLSHYEAATKESETALGQQYSNYKRKYCGRSSYKKQIATLDKGASEAMYWYAASLGKFALAKSIILVLNEKDRIKAMMDALYSWNPAFFYYAADRYFGAYFTKIPFPSGDLDRSARHFEASMKGAPNYLATPVLYASLNLGRAYSKAKTAEAKKAIRTKYKALLDAVIAFDLSKAPALIPENTIEKKKAKALLEEIDVNLPVDD